MKHEILHHIITQSKGGPKLYLSGLTCRSNYDVGCSGGTLPAKQYLSMQACWLAMITLWWNVWLYLVAVIYIIVKCMIVLI